MQLTQQVWRRWFSRGCVKNASWLCHMHGKVDCIVIVVGKSNVNWTTTTSAGCLAIVEMKMIAHEQVETSNTQQVNYIWIRRPAVWWWACALACHQCFMLLSSVGDDETISCWSHGDSCFFIRCLSAYDMGSKKRHVSRRNEVRFSHEHLESRHILLHATRSLSSFKYDTNTKVRKSTANNDPITDRISCVIRARKENHPSLEDEVMIIVFSRAKKLFNVLWKGIRGVTCHNADMSRLFTLISISSTVDAIHCCPRCRST